LLEMLRETGRTILRELPSVSRGATNTDHPN